MGMERTRIRQIALLVALIGVYGRMGASIDNASRGVDVRVKLTLSDLQRSHAPPAVIWLKALSGSDSQPPTKPGRFTLLQKNRTFTPHLLVVPVGSLVQFPNQDPFFHNVFSLFDGRRFDLGLYESGSSKGVDFSREGVSYIFCNIHPEMSAVVIALSTPYYAKADDAGVFEIREVPAGDYELHVWVEGVVQSALDSLTRRVHVAPGAGDLGALNTTAIPRQPSEHLNKFGQPYDRDFKPIY